jgi:hypothetical protein
MTDKPEMDDRTLLELAAKAVGWRGWRSKHGYWNVERPDGTSQSCCQGWMSFDPSTGQKLPKPALSDALVEAGFDPLTDDGDALRLAVTLGLMVQIAPEHRMATAMLGTLIIATEMATAERIEVVPALTRRAIVRVAADIGKAMP